VTREVLIVDDAATVRLYHRSILAKAGFDVTDAVNGYEGLEVALAKQFDLIMVDVNMPKMDGYTLVASIRAEGANRSTPVMMVTTEDSELDAARGYEAGANAYLTKPVAGEQLSALANMLTASQP
jgi:two-component system chemotaxis response regulator CheY